MIRICIYTFLLGILLVSCTDESCYEPKEAPIRMSVFDKENMVPISFNDLQIIVGSDTLLLKNISIGGIGAPNDSLINKEATGLKMVTAPLHINKDTTSFFLRYNFEDVINIYDTIMVIHENKENFISIYCGCMIFHQIENVQYTTNLIDSIAYINQTITNAEEVHLQLLY